MVQYYWVFPPKMNHFVQNKSEAIKALEKWKRIRQVYSQSSLDIQVYKTNNSKAATKMNAFQSCKLSRRFVQNGVPIKNNLLPEKSSNGAGKAFLIKTFSKMLL